MDQPKQGYPPERIPPYNRRSHPWPNHSAGRAALNPLAAAFIPGIPNDPWFENSGVEGGQTGAAGLEGPFRRLGQPGVGYENPIDTEPIQQIPPRGPALKHRFDPEPAHTPGGLVIRRQVVRGESITLDELQQYVSMDGTAWQNHEARAIDVLPQSLQRLHRQAERNLGYRLPAPAFANDDRGVGVFGLNPSGQQLQGRLDEPMAQKQQLHVRPLHALPPQDPEDDVRIPTFGTVTDKPITLFSPDGYAVHVLDLTLGNTHPGAVLQAQNAHKRAAARRQESRHIPADRVIELALCNNVFQPVNNGPRGAIWAIPAGREDILAALEEFPPFAGGRWHLLGVGREGSEGLLYMLRPPYDRALMQMES
ncbi:hypothetical protein AOQ84DRAFT_230400 [Glonium stellatum]|uniref:Uncharacterized protein n=1 Tax=Glonium stellatum TaxID=574774 RepID=A0A8E2JVI1_9PEZI|nr:hypothetical protein AOQ84DRAFT_230400 [Glonium stellatum]